MASLPICSETAKFAPTNGAVCAVALSALLPLAGVQSRQLRPQVHTSPVATGDAAFDAAFVTTGDPAGLPGLLTAEVRARMLARDDWSFLAERYWFGCITERGFRTPEEVLERVDAVRAVVAALPAELVPAPVEPAVDDLVTLRRLHPRVGRQNPE